MKEGEKAAKEVSVNCNSFYLLCHLNGLMHMNIIISTPAIKVIDSTMLLYCHIATGTY